MGFKKLWGFRTKKLGPTSLVPTSSLPNPEVNISPLFHHSWWRVGFFLFQWQIVSIDCKGLLHANKEVEMALVVLNDAWLNADYASSSGTLVVSPGYSTGGRNAVHCSSPSVVLYQIYNRITSPGYK